LQRFADTTQTKQKNAENGFFAQLAQKISKFKPNVLYVLPEEPCNNRMVALC
jgi:hypothetical protein